MYELTKIDVWSMAKFQAVLMALVGFLVGVVVTIRSFVENVSFS